MLEISGREEKITSNAYKNIQSKQVDPFYIKEIIKNQISTETTLKDELLIIRYSADEKFYQCVASTQYSCEMQVLIEWRSSTFKDI